MNDHDQKELLSRRAMARESLKVLLAAGASVLALSMSTSRAFAGYGTCSIPGCNCQAYVGQDPTCGNCGHNFGSHN